MTAPRAADNNTTAWPLRRVACGPEASPCRLHGGLTYFAFDASSATRPHLGTTSKPGILITPTLQIDHPSHELHSHGLAFVHSRTWSQQGSDYLELTEAHYHANWSLHAADDRGRLCCMSGHPAARALCGATRRNLNGFGAGGSVHRISFPNGLRLPSSTIICAELR